MVVEPALVLPRLAVKPRAWRESSIRPDVPDDIRAWLDSMDEKTLRESLKAIGDACRAAGFDPAMQACGEILRSNRDMGLHADSLTPIALRMRDGEWECSGIEEPDLSGYDRFITGTDDGGRTVSVRPDPVIPETRRRRASTTEKSKRIRKMSRRSLTPTDAACSPARSPRPRPASSTSSERWFTAELDLARGDPKRLRACSNRPPASRRQDRTRRLRLDQP